MEHEILPNTGLASRIRTTCCSSISVVWFQKRSLKMRVFFSEELVCGWLSVCCLFCEVDYVGERARLEDWESLRRIKIVLRRMRLAIFHIGLPWSNFELVHLCVSGQIAHD